MVITSITDLSGQNANTVQFPDETAEILNIIRLDDVKDEAFYKLTDSLQDRETHFVSE